jgi:hypothetical protein
METIISVYYAIIMSRIGSSMESKRWMRRVFIIRRNTGDYMNK